MVVVVRIADRVLVAVIVVAVTPEHEFLEHEEQRDAGDQRDADLVHVLACPRRSTACGISAEQRRA